MNEKITFQIQILDECTRMPIKNAKLQLQNVNVGQESIANTQGIASFSIRGKSVFNLIPFQKEREEYEKF